MALDNGIGSRDEFITAISPLASGTAAYDDDGRLVTSGTRTEITFWASLDDMKSDTLTNPLNPGRRDTRLIKLMCDSRDVDSVDIDYTLTRGGGTDVFQVVDKYDTDFKFTTAIIAQYVS